MVTEKYISTQMYNTKGQKYEKHLENQHELLQKPDASDG